MQEQRASRRRRAAAAQSSRPTLLNGLKAYWKLDEVSAGAAAVARADVLGLSHLTDINTTASAAGKRGQAALLVAANNENLVCASNPALVLGDFDFTIDAWVKLTSAGANQVVFSKDDNTGAVRDLVLYVSNANRLTAMIWDTAGTPKTCTDSTMGALAAGTWYYVAITHDATANKITLWKDNQSQEFAHATGARANGTAQWRIGIMGTTGSTVNPMNGAVDEVGKWSRKLSAAEMAKRYNSGSGNTYPF
jgi:hypothetical protein